MENLMVDRGEDWTYLHVAILDWLVLWHDFFFYRLSAIAGDFYVENLLYIEALLCKVLWSKKRITLS